MREALVTIIVGFGILTVASAFVYVGISEKMIPSKVGSFKVKNIPDRIITATEENAYKITGYYQDDFGEIKYITIGKEHIEPVQK